MNLKAISALIMGLLLQWSVVAALPTAEPANACASAAAPMTCCASAKSCPCLDKQDSSGEKPAPLAPSAPDLKLVFIEAPTTDDNVAATPLSELDSSTPQVRAGPTAGFPGVPLSVAFCSFVI